MSWPELYFGLISGITQDPQGYMWLAVNGRGLYRYDGYTLVNYGAVPGSPNSLSSNAVKVVYADHNGIIWVGTESLGLDRFNPSTGIFTHYKNIEDDTVSLSNDRVTSIIEDHEGTLWVGTIDGLNRFVERTGTFKRYMNSSIDSNSISNNSIEVLYVDKRGKLWIGTSVNYGSINDQKKIIWPTVATLNCYDKKTNNFTRYLLIPKDPYGRVNNNVGAIFEDSKGNFWINMAADGLHTMNREKGTFERHSYDPTHPEKLSVPPRKKDYDFNLDHFFINEDSSGAIWIGSSGGWITRYDPKAKKARHFDSFNNDGRVMETVSASYVSRDGVLWLTTLKGFIYRINPFQATIKHFPVGSIVYNVHEDVTGALWLGTCWAGLIRIDRNVGKIRRFLNGPSGPLSQKDQCITAIFESRDSTIWIGSSSLSRYDIKTKRFTKYSHHPQDTNSLSSGDIAAIIEDQPGSLWIATGGGLDHFDIKTAVFKRYRNDPKYNNSLGFGLTSLLKDHTGKLWIGTYDGIVNRFDQRTGEVHGFPCNGIVGSIIEDSDNIIWVATSTGLFRSDAAVDSFFRFSFTDPRFAMKAPTYIAGIIEDDKKNLWISSLTGIIRLNLTRNEINVYNVNQGVDPTGFSTHFMKAEKGSRGELFFADGDGYYSFFPDRVKTNTTPPQINISNLWVVDKSIKPGKDSLVNILVENTKEIKLKYYQNVFSFKFAGIHYSSPEENLHLFKLENLDNDWGKPGPEKTAYYYNVPPGKYIFHVKAANSDGLWAEKSILITITPPWWTSWWFRITAVFCAGVIFYVIIRWRIHQKFRRQLERSEKEKLVAEMKQKTAELQQQTTELEMQALRAQMNPHFIFNCLSSINRFILKNESETASDYLTKFSRLIRMVLNNSQNPLITLEDELEMLRLYLDLEKLRFKDSFGYAIRYNDLDLASIYIPPLLLQPFAENAIWHGLMNKEGKGLLDISLESDNGTLSCYITDNGIGRKQAETLKSKSAEKQKSMGMRITAERLALLNKDDEQTIFYIEDLVDTEGRAAGTKVTLKIRFKGTLEELH
ncbi:MAG: two-component regulator propeller domain-containing protein [Chitinophagales bacterium]